MLIICLHHQWLQVTPTAVFRTVGHMAQMAMVKSAAASEVPNVVRPVDSITLSPLKSTIPRGSQARGDTGRRIWMIGSNARVKFLESPRKKPMGVPSRSAMAYPWATSLSESQVKRRV